MKRNPLSIISIRRAILILLVCFISMSIMAQKVNLYTLDIDQLNLYKDKAVKMRNAGMILTFSGVGVALTGCIVGAIMNANIPSYDPYHDHDWDWVAGAGVMLISSTVGLATTVVGIPKWIIGGSRKAKAEIALKMVDFKTDNSMAVGLGITLRF